MTAWLLTWLWQGAVLAGGVAVALGCAPRLNAATKHLAWCGVLVAVAWLGWASSPYRGVPSLEVPGPEPIYVASAPALLITVLAGIWAAAAIVNLLRLLRSLHAISALRDRCRPFPPHVEAQLPLWLEAKAQGRSTQLMVCDEVAGATVLGFRHPCIAIPSALADALTTGELDLAVLHEHAHVQRRDDWARLAQMLLLSVLWIHPAALFVSRALNREREMACDEWVVARTGSPKAYASCLAHAAEIRGSVRSGAYLVPAFVGGRHDLVRRVERLLTMKKARRHVSAGGAAGAALAILLLSAQLQSVRGLAEVAEIVLPVDLAERAQWMPRVREVRGPVPVQPPRDLRKYPRADTRVRIAAIASAVAPEVQIAPAADDLSSRSFPGSYYLTAPSSAVGAADAPDTPNAPDTPSTPPNLGWRSLAAPGLEIASAAKKSGVGLAGVFSRAGVSLARSF